MQRAVIGRQSNNLLSTILSAAYNVTTNTELRLLNIHSLRYRAHTNCPFTNKYNRSVVRNRTHVTWHSFAAVEREMIVYLFLVKREL